MGTKGYFYADCHHIGDGKDRQAVDCKLSKLYKTEIDASQRRYNRRHGVSNCLYVRYQNIFVLLATKGSGRIWREQNLIDMRHSPLCVLEHTIRILPRGGRKYQALIEYEKDSWQKLESRLLRCSLVADSTKLQKIVRSNLRKAQVMAFRGSLIQQYQLVKKINEKRKKVGYKRIDQSCLIRKR